MKVAIVGSRSLSVEDLSPYLPKETSEIVSGGARGVETCARNFARENNLKLKEFLPEYARYGKSAPLKRNLQIIDYADLVIAFWDGSSRGDEICDRTLQKEGQEGSGLSNGVKKRKFPAMRKAGALLSASAFFIAGIGEYLLQFG